jgi:hypothetical protein
MLNSKSFVPTLFARLSARRRVQEKLHGPYGLQLIDRVPLNLFVGLIITILIIISFFLFNWYSPVFPQSLSQVTAAKGANPVYPAWASMIIDDITKLLTSLGIVIGGFWVYLNTCRGRLYRHRLELIVSTNTIRRDDVIYISVSFSLKNVGLSGVAIRRRGTCCSVKRHQAMCDLIRVIKWENEIELYLFRIFEDHKWVEPSETIYDNAVIPLSTDQSTSDLYCFGARVISDSRESSQWKASCVTTAYE